MNEWSKWIYTRIENQNGIADGRVLKKLQQQQSARIMIMS